LFEWKWTEIAKECERFLGPNGYGAVQVSPPNEHAVVTPPWRPWWESYQPVSYKLESRRGNRVEFADMVARCNKQGVRIYVDAVVNHMAAKPETGTGHGSGGSEYNTKATTYSGVPWSAGDFNGRDNCHSGNGEIQNYGDVQQVRNCRLVGLPDLRLSKNSVRRRVAEYFNDLISLGVAGIRIDAAKHMWPEDISAILGMTKDLSPDHGFAPGSRLFVYQEVIDMGGEPVKKEEYVGMGRVTEFRFSIVMGQLGRKQNPLKNFKNLGASWGFLKSGDAWVFVDNHDNQRGHGAGGAVVTFREPTSYKIANAFMLAFPYGFPKVMSSYTTPVGITGNNDWVGPPASHPDGAIKDVPIQPDGSCGDEWVCEHRWNVIKNMVKWRNAAADAHLANWWDNGNNQIAFSRGDKAFIAMNNEGSALDKTLSTGLPAGTYCDIISGSPTKSGCSGTTVTVGPDGFAQINVPSGNDPMVAIHVNAKSGSGGGGGEGTTSAPPKTTPSDKTTATSKTTPKTTAKTTMTPRTTTSGGTETCKDSDDGRQECGYFGIQQSGCEGKGCCWKPSSRSGVPWCYKKSGGSSGGGDTGGCNKDVYERKECGYFGIQQQECEASGCCWKPSSINGIPWCFKK